MMRVFPRPVCLLRGIRLANAAMSAVLFIFLGVLILSSLDCASPTEPMAPVALDSDDSLALAAILEANGKPWPKVASSIFSHDALGRITSLNLSRSELDTIPPEIATLSALTRLDLSRNFLRSIPHEIEYLTRLENLNLSWNTLAALPDGLRLTRLKNLNLSWNILPSLPGNIDVTSLVSLNLDRNQIRVLPPDFKYLRELSSLSMVGNRLDSLPSDIGELASLKFLDLSGNQITALPEGIMQLNFDFLSMAGNRLCALQATEPDPTGTRMAQWLDGLDRDWRVTQKCK